MQRLRRRIIQNVLSTPIFYHSKNITIRLFLDTKDMIYDF